MLPLSVGGRVMQVKDVSYRNLKNSQRGICIARLHARYRVLNPFFTGPVYLAHSNSESATISEIQWKFIELLSQYCTT